MMISRYTKMKSYLIDQIQVKSDDQFIGYANKYKIVLKYQNRSGSFEFTDSIDNTNKGNDLKIKDILYCLVMDYSCKDYCFDEFCLEFGYDNDSIKSQIIHKAVIKNAEKMDRIFRDHMELLSKELENY